MDRNSIITLPHDHLRQRSKKVGLITPELITLVGNMKSAVVDWEHSRKHEVGVALAAVQVDELYRVIVIRANFDDKQDETFNVFINPEITKTEGELIEDYEGCLSVKDIYGRVPRYPKVKVKALDIHGKPIRITAEGFLARVFQHEIDHTKGKLFIDHIRRRKDAFFQLNDEGQLESLDYEKDIRDNRILW